LKRLLGEGDPTKIAQTTLALIASLSSQVLGDKQNQHRSVSSQPCPVMRERVLDQLDAFVDQGRSILRLVSISAMWKAFEEWDDAVGNWLAAHAPGTGTAGEWAGIIAPDLYSGPEDTEAGLLSETVRRRIQWLATLQRNSSQKAATTLPRTAVLIDGDWLIHATRQMGLAVDFERFGTELRHAFGVQTPIVFVLSVDDSRPPTSLLAALEGSRFDIEAVHVRPGKGSAADVQLAARGASLPNDIDRLVLVSGDNDFGPLLQQARAAGRSTVLVTLPIGPPAT
jgi:hypothetical protein